MKNDIYVNNEIMLKVEVYSPPLPCKKLKAYLRLNCKKLKVSFRFLV